MGERDRNFACTQCGKCCDRSPEVELGEAAPLADVFVWRLMFRIHLLPRDPRDYAIAGDGARERSIGAFFQTKRLLSAYSARATTMKLRCAGRNVEYVGYLVVSALATDRGRGACIALQDGRCTIYSRRPLVCRTAPFHYSVPEARGLQEFDQFVGRPGYECDTNSSAPPAVIAAKIVAQDITSARASALVQTAADGRWKEAIIRRMKAGGLEGLPTLPEVEAARALGALTTSMRLAWDIAADAGLIDRNTAKAAITSQIGAIDRMIAMPNLEPMTKSTLVQMRREYAAMI